MLKSQTVIIAINLAIKKNKISRYNSLSMHFDCCLFKVVKCTIFCLYVSSTRELEQKVTANCLSTLILFEHFGALECRNAHPYLDE